MEPLFTIEKKATLEDYQRTIRFLSRRNLREQGRRLVPLAGALVLLLIVTSGWKQALLWLAIYALVVAAVMAVTLLVVVPLKAKKRFAGRVVAPDEVMPIRFYEGHVEWTGGEAGGGHVEYAKLYGLAEDEAAFYLLLDKNRALSVPKAACNADQARFIRACRSPKPAEREANEAQAAPEAEESTEGLVFETRVTYDFPQYQRLNRAMRRKQLPLKLCIYGGGLVAVAVFLGLWRGWVFAGVGIGFYALVLGLSQLIEAKITVPRAEKAAFESNQAVKDGELRTRFYRDRMEVTSPVGRVSAAYDKVRDVIETEENLYVVTAADGAAILDRAALTEEQIAFVRQLKPVR